MELVSLNDGIVGVVSKLEDRSPLAAASLVEYGLYEALCDYAEEHHAEISKVLYDAARVEVSKARSVAKRMGDETLVGTLEEVEKKLVGYDLHLFNSRVKRDQAGRFATQNTKGSDEDDSSGGSGGAKKRPSGTRVQEQSKPATKALDRAVRSGLIKDETELRVKYGHDLKGEGDLQPTKLSAADLRARLQEPSFANSVADIEVVRGNADVPKGSSDSASLFDLASVATDAGRAKRVSEALTNSSGNVDPAAFRRAGEDFTRASSGNDRRAYRQMAALGSATRALSDPGSDIHLAGAMASIVGRLGPEAEAVLGPGMRRTAYRYRGTERRPDANMRAATGRANNLAASLEQATDGDVGNMAVVAESRFMRPQDPRRQGSQSRPDDEVGGIIAGALKDHGPDVQMEADDPLPDSRHSTTGSIDSALLQIRGDTAVANMLGALKGSRSVLPTRQQIEISRKSGSQPPSQGVIIDAEGNLVTQAHGFNGDHYVPFDLKNLKALRGGQYIRTRAMGGPTSEDFYTGLMSGARQFQVVSNSGVFTVQFDPDLRGGRRYSDKSRKMVKRYEEILETIADPDNKHGLMAQDFTPEQKAEIRERAHKMSRTPEDFDANLKNEMARARFSLMSTDQQDEIEQAVEYELGRIERKRGAPLSSQERARLSADVQGDVIRSIQDLSPRQMQLNGDGYAAALDTLQAEFPYFIRDVKYEQLRQWADKRGLRAKDGLPGAGASMRSDSGYKSRSAVEGELRAGYGPPRSAAGASQDAAASDSGTPALVPTAGGAQAAKPASGASSSSNKGELTPERIKNSLHKEMRSAVPRLAHQLLKVETHWAEDDIAEAIDAGGEKEKRLRRKDILDYVVGRVERGKSPHDELVQVFQDLTADELIRLENELENSVRMKMHYEHEESAGDVGAGRRLKKEMLEELHSAVEIKVAMEPMREATVADRPSHMDDRPPRVEGIPNHMVPRRDFEAAAAQFEAGQSANFRSTMADISGAEDPKAEVNRLLDETDFDSTEDEDEYLRELNTAWALVATDRANAKVNELAGGGTPKAREETSKSLRPGRVKSTSRTSAASEYLSEVAKRIDRLYEMT